MNECDYLKQCPLFSQLNDHEVELLAHIVERKPYSKGQCILKEGEFSTEIYIITIGKTSAIKYDQNTHRVTLNTFLPGDYFGEMSFIDTEPRSASIIAEEYTEVLIIPQEGFQKIFSDNSRILSLLLKGILRRFRHTTTRLNKLLLDVAQQERHDAHLDTIRRLVTAAEHKDYDTGEHLSRISKYSGLIAEKIGLPRDQIQYIYEAAPMHDIGKIGVPEYILQKPGRLTHEEFIIIKAHPQIGAEILSNPQSELLECAYQIALFHHEKFDGTGYPTGISGLDIPIAARIVSLADAFDALTSKRPYQEPVSTEESLEIIKKDRGTHFDPTVIDIFVEYFEEILNIKEKFVSLK